MADIDIDFGDRTKILEFIDVTHAAIIQPDGSTKRHPSGVYATPIPYNPLTDLCALDYKEAERRN